MKYIKTYEAVNGIKSKGKKEIKKFKNEQYKTFNISKLSNDSLRYTINWLDLLKEINTF